MLRKFPWYFPLKKKGEKFKNSEFLNNLIFLFSKISCTIESWETLQFFFSLLLILSLYFLSSNFLKPKVDPINQHGLRDKKAIYLVLRNAREKKKMLILCLI